jgi:serine/threonine-protein kinase
LEGKLALMTSIASYKVDHLIGQQVGTSTLLKELARGGMAIVFIAYQRTLKRQIAVKILPKSLITAQAAERFQQEAEAAAILSHPNIIPVYEVGETDEFLFFTMQLVQGHALSKYMKAAQRNIIPSKRTLPLDSVLNLICQILDALDYAHRQGIVHRDIKPGNILIEQHTKRPLITDFGIAKIVGSNSTSGTLVHGTPLYMAPEQVVGPNSDNRADIYALAIMLFQMLVPRLPLPPLKAKSDLLKLKLSNRNGIFLKTPSESNPQLNAAMDPIIGKALAYAPGDRYGSCREFLEALENYRRTYLPSRRD